jgi:CBS domain-containing protein
VKRMVQDVMTRDVVVVIASTPFKEIVRRMQEHRVSAVAVLDAGARLVGIVSEADLLLKEDTDLEGEGRLFEGRQRRTEREKHVAVVAGQLMTSPPVRTGPVATLAEAARLMHRRGIKRLPVVSAEGRVLGIVSRADLLKVFLRDDGEIAREISEDIVRRTLWIDPTTIRVIVHDGVVRLDGQIERRSLIPVLAGLVLAVEGVVGIDSHLSYLVNDTAPPAELPLPWTAITPGRGR